MIQSVRTIGAVQLCGLKRSLNALARITGWKSITKGGQTSTVQYLYEGLQALGEIRDQSLSHRLLTGLSLDETIARLAINSGSKDSANSRLYLTDALNSVIAQMNDNESVTLGNSYGYSPYGQSSTLGADATGNPIQYTSRENDGTGLIYYRNRFRSPAAGWTSDDPSGFEGGMSAREVVEGDPINLVDPLGLWAIGDPLPQPIVDFSAGFGDGVLLGAGGLLREVLGVDGGISNCTKSYRAGSWISFGLGVSRLAYAGVAKAGTVMAKSGVEASAFRQKMKGKFRMGAAKNWRPPDLSKYKTDEALRAAAGRTNPYMNAYGVGVAGVSAYGGLGCECD